MTDGKYRLTLSQCIFTICHMSKSKRKGPVAVVASNDTISPLKSPSKLETNKKSIHAINKANKALWLRFSDNSARHLIALSRHMQMNMMHKLTQDCGYDGLRLNYEPFISALSQRATDTESDSLTQALARQKLRPSRLADQLGISKQDCNQTLNKLERHGYIQRVSDPQDGRAKLLELTAKGVGLARDGKKIVETVEALYKDIVSRFSVKDGAQDQSFEAFIVYLESIAKGLALLPESVDFSHLSNGQILGGVLPPLSQYVSRRLMALTMAKGHPEITMAHGQVLSLIGFEGGRIQQMAQINNVSKQAISATANDLERLGYIVRQPVSIDRDGSDNGQILDKSDSRSSLLIFTQLGWRLIADSIESVTELESELSVHLADRKPPAKRAGTSKVFKSFSALLGQLYHALRLEEEVFDRPLLQVMGADKESPGAQLDLGLLATQLKSHLGPLNSRMLAELLLTE